MKTLAFLVILGALTLLPAGVVAQELPHRFFGTVFLLDGTTAPDGTVVAAIVDGEVVKTATVESSFQPGFYLLEVTPPVLGAFVGLTVSFTIDGQGAVESAPWVIRQVQELNLTVSAIPADTTAPVFTVPDSIELVAETPEGTHRTNPEIAAFLNGATATDDLDPSPVVTNDAPALFPSDRATVVIFTATDEAGNQSTSSATVTVLPFPLDVLEPVLTLPDDIVVDAESAEGTPITNPDIGAFLNAATATDDRDPGPVVTHDAPVLFPSGEDTIVTFAATDDAGNESTGTATVTVRPFVSDTTAPVLALPGDIEVETETAEGTPITDPEIAVFLNSATATDDRDPNTVVTNDAPDIFPSGSDTVVTFTVTDATGNESTGTATVTVKAFLTDTTAPVLTLPNDMEVETETDEGTPVTNAQIAGFLNAATATDDRDPNPVVTHDAPALFPQGQRTVVTFTATDETGNESTGTATVTVEPFTIPLPPIEVKTEVTADPDTTVIVDVEGVIIELVDAPVAFQQVEERIVLALPVPPDTGKLESFTDPTTGITIEDTVFTIPIRDDEDNVVFTFTGVLEEAPVGGQAIAKELRLQTAEEGGTVDLAGLDPRAGEVTVVLDTEVVSLTVAPVINLEVGTDIAPAIQFQFGQLAKDNARQVSGDVGAVLTVDTNLDNKDALVTFRIGLEWVREVVLAVTPPGVFDPDDLSLINDVIFIGRLSDTGDPQFLDANCTGPDGGGRYSCTANSPAGLSIFGLLALPPVEHDAVPIFALALPDDINVEVDTVGGARLENDEIQGFLDSALTGQESAVEVFVSEPFELPSIFAKGDNRLIFGGTDELGNFATDFATITVVHELPPILIVPANRVIDSREPLAASDPRLQEFINEAQASAALEGALVVTNDAPDPFPFGDTVVTFTTTDNTGKRSSASVTLTVNQVAPDVRVTGVKVTPSSVIGDRPVTVAVQVENFGTAPGTFLLEIRLDDQVVESVEGTLIQGESQTITREIVGQVVGEHRVEVAGTSAKFLVEVGPVDDIRVVDVQVRPASAESSAEITLTLRVENAGEVGGERVLVLLLDGQVLEEVTVSLAPGARETIVLIRQAPAPGHHVVKVGGVSARFQVVESGGVAGQPRVTSTSPEATLPPPAAQATSAPVQPAATVGVASTPEPGAPREADSDEGGLSGGALAGIIGGVLVIVAALAIGVVLLLRRRPSPVAEVEPDV